MNIQHLNKLSPSKITCCLFQQKSARSVETASLCNLKRSLKDPFNVSRESHNSGLTSAASLSLHTHSVPIESRCWVGVVGVPLVRCAECRQPPGPEIELAGWMQMRSFLWAYLQCQLLITLSTVSTIDNFPAQSHTSLHWGQWAGVLQTSLPT